MRLGVGVRLSLGLLVLVSAALLIVYLAVVPSLENRLIDQRRDELARTAAAVASRYEEDVSIAQDVVESAGTSTNSRAFLLEHLGGGVLRVFADSLPFTSPPRLSANPVALRALRTQAPARGAATRSGTEYAEVAVPLGEAGELVLLLTAPLTDTLTTVRTVERRMLAAGAVGLVFAAGLGLGAASLHARRIGRLRGAADRIAHGDFGEPVVDRGSDELGALADSFERMRGRLSALEHARREFVANASHELRTPIFAVASALELLEDEELDEATRDDFIHTMREQVDRLTRLAADLLDLSRLDAGRLPVEAQAFDLTETAAALAREFEAAALTAGHPLELEANGAVIAVADPDRVLRIGRALLENAIVHTPSGTAVRIRTDREDGSALLEVVDDGPGIPAGETDQVFDRFYRVGGERASGSGLGLAIARELAELMGGVLTLERAATGGGARFSVRLPAG